MNENHVRHFERDLFTDPFAISKESKCAQGRRTVRKIINRRKDLTFSSKTNDSIRVN